MKSKKFSLQIFVLLFILAGVIGLSVTSTNSRTSISQLDLKDPIKTSQGAIKIGVADWDYDNIG